MSFHLIMFLRLIQLLSGFTVKGSCYLPHLLKPWCTDLHKAFSNPVSPSQSEGSLLSALFPPSTRTITTHCPVLASHLSPLLE